MKKISNLLKTLFYALFPLPIKTTSFQEFITKTKKDSIGLITVKAETISDQSVVTAGVGSIGITDYNIVSTARTINGRVILFREKCFNWYGSSRGFIDSDERGANSIKLYLFAEETIKKLKGHLPDRQIECLAPPDQGGYFNKSLWKRLHTDAATLGITI